MKCESGKTMSYVIPIINDLLMNEKGLEYSDKVNRGAIVISPNKELNV